MKNAASTSEKLRRTEKEQQRYEPEDELPEKVLRIRCRPDDETGLEDRMDELCFESRWP